MTLFQGDSSGKVKVLEVDKRVAVPDAKNADAMWKTLRENLAEMDEKRTKQTLDGETAA